MDRNVTNWRYASIQQVVKLEEWQKLRLSFLGTWKTSPTENVKKLRDFLGEKPWNDYRKLRIVLNYVTGSGFRIGVIQHADIDRLKEEVKTAKQRMERITKIEFVEEKKNE